MSHFEPKRSQKTIITIKNLKTTHQKISMVTCYDASFARIITTTDIDIVLVGDSLGNVVLGFDNTLKVTLDHMVLHSASVVRGLQSGLGQKPTPLLCVDLPFLTYTSVEDY